MSPSLNAIVQLIAILSIMPALMSWLKPTDSLESELFRWIATFVFLGAMGLIFWTRFKKDSEKDYLAYEPGPVFERDGFCFALTFARKNGAIKLTVRYQCRFSGGGKALISIRPTKSLGLRFKFETIQIPIRFEPGGHGVVEQTIKFPDENRGKSGQIDIFCNTKYDNKKGPQVRSRPGIAVGTIKGQKWINGVAVTAAALVQAIYVSPARMKITIPPKKQGPKISTR